MKAKVLFILCSGWIAVGLLAAQVGPPGISSSRGKQVSSIPELLALASDPKANVDSAQIADFLAALPAADRQTVQRQLVRSAHEMLALSAAHYEIKSRDTVAVAAIASRMSVWTPRSQSSILLAASNPRGAFLDIARVALRAAIGKSADPQSRKPALDPAGRAALLLCKTGLQPDAALVRDAMRVRPKSWGLWMAVAHGGLTDQTLTAIANGMYKDATVDLPVRVAAATALEPLDAQAAAFALGQVQSFVSKFGGTDIAAQMADAIRERQNKSSPAVTKELEYRNDFHLLTSLLVLQANTAKQLTLQSLTAKNEEIKLLCAIVAARRWPADLLASGLTTFSARRQVELRALLALNHPENAATAAAGISPEAMNSAKEALSKAGLAVFGAAGMALIFF